MSIFTKDTSYFFILSSIITITPLLYADKHEAAISKSDVVSQKKTQIDSIAKKLGRSESPNKTTVLFAHGFSGNKMRKYLYAKGYEKLLRFLYNTDEKSFTKTPFIFDKKIHNMLAFNFPDVYLDFGIFGSLPSMRSSYVAQEKDVKTLLQALSNIQNDEVVGFGVSRGAATWITALGSSESPKKIRGLILESPFAKIKNTSLFSWIKRGIKSIFDCFGYNLSKDDHKNYTKRGFNMLIQRHDVDGTQPIDLIDRLDKTIPILLIHSKEDAIIPINDSRKLYLKLLESGHKHAYLVEFETGAHANLPWEKKGIGVKYRNITHAFFKAYNLPHNAAYAKAEDLKAYQPSAREVIKQIKLENYYA